MEQWLDLHHGKTRLTYQNTISKFSGAVPKSVADIHFRHVREWLDKMQVADTTKVKHLNILKAFFSYVTGLEHPPINRSPIPKQFKLPFNFLTSAIRSYVRSTDSNRVSHGA